ncbi:hypothetical protein AOL_s00169g46 [Orbilia oligospora ATCC 24927]|uniref:DNA recombination and repair protein Rad51-like C-terminal domain-containing protein n=1 Tax=Arthrobotrys oligospora (strain ATCC 24927 / CBS 115.81 / DSM 1491) TaxID=756982 RepID=G1XMJ3_ARTOA|nr:hypothetical protein AOL_s00169g46 [Orbilia oligospora ATCC 24927]EGX45440.1 hypothetical protein AOL_s00169g46 [Orbilia oligospora ATCC 24927]
MTNPPLPSLGSDLLTKASHSSTSAPHPRTLKTSFPPIDTAINGIKYGRITNIQCEIANHGTVLSHHIIASHLLDPSQAAERSQVAYVDTTGSFSAVNLLKVLEYRLQQGATQERGSSTTTNNTNTAAIAGGDGSGTSTRTAPGGSIGRNDVRQHAVELLDRVQYMRTFDFDGVMETVAEVFGGMPKTGVERVGAEDEEEEVNVEAESKGLGLHDAEEAIQDSIVEEKEEEEVNPKSRITTPEEGEEEEVKKEQTPENEDHMEVEPAGSPAEQLGERTAIPDSEADSDEEIFWPIPLLPKHDPGLQGNRKRRRDIRETESGLETAVISGETRDLHENDPEPSRSLATTEEGEGEAEREEIPVPPDLAEALPQPLPGRNFGVIVFDNISRPLENLLEKGEVEANSKLTLLSQGLRSLARDQGIAILLLSTPAILPPNTKEQKKDTYIKNSSIFARIQPTEGLPRTLGSCLDHNIMVSRYPQNEVTSHRRRSGGQDKFIIETVAERHGGSVGQWGGFMIKVGHS